MSLTEKNTSPMLYFTDLVSDIILELRYIMYVVTIITCLCHVTLLNLDSSLELDSQVVEICQDSLFLLRPYNSTSHFCYCA